MRRRRTIYHNDARHCYLWLFEPPMELEDAWVPVDEVAGTAVDTFSYGVARTDGLFYDSRVGLRFGADRRPFSSHIEWRAWECMQSLVDRGLDPLTVLIDRSHDKGMDFVANLRLGAYGGMDPGLSVSQGGPGFAGAEIRDHQFAVLEELATRYDTEGVELDFSCAPGGSPFYFRDEEARQSQPIMTEWLRRVADMVRARDRGPGLVGARVYPNEETNLAQGLEVRRWLEEGLIDYAVPVMYSYNSLDPDMPFDWLVQAAHAVDVPVYGFLQHYVRSEDTGAAVKEYPTPEIMRAAAASYWDRGVDGLYTWFMKWPLGDAERRILTELGDPDLVRDGDKRYVLARRAEAATELGYVLPLPVTLSAAGGATQALTFHIADDLENRTGRVGQVRLRAFLSNAVSADELRISLNGRPLATETCRRLRKTKPDTFPPSSPRNHWLDFTLEQVRPRQGRNLLELCLVSRPEGLVGDVTVEEVEILVEYSSYPTQLASRPE